MKNLKTMKAVYCYPFPEIQPRIDAVDAVWTREMNKVTTPAKFVYDKLEPLFNPPLEIPATDDGYFSADEIHVPIIRRVADAYSPLVPALENFGHSYPTSGSCEGIFKLLTKLKVGGTTSINVLNGEYEGYEEYAGKEDLKMNVNVIDLSKTDIQDIEPGVWFISNPSARDGNILSNSAIKKLYDNGHKVILDLAYVGSTRPYKFDVSHENIPAVVMSLSKPYGFFRSRVGFVFSKEPMHSLYGNKWFKDPERLVQGLKLVEELGPDKKGSTKLYEKYRMIQTEIIGEINDEFGLGIVASDALLLGYMTDEVASGLENEQLDIIKGFKRGKGYRFCLTPYFEKREKMEDLIC